MKTNTIITIGRQYGSGGKEIGHFVAEAFGIKLYDKEMLARMDGFSGVVQAIHLEDGTVDVLISMFGRETAATLQLNQVIRQDD